MPDRLRHFEIGISDMDRAKEFYGALFGWRFHSDGPNYAMIQTGSDLEGGLTHISTNRPPWLVLYMQVDDIDEKLEQAKELGAEIVKRKTLIHEDYGYFGLFKDPSGNLVGLLSDE